MLKKINLFEARTKGYHVYRIPGIAVAPGGTILATCEARRGNGGDWDGNDVLIRRSADGGDTWDEQRTVVACADYGPGPISNFVMIPDGELDCVHGIFCHNYERVFYLRSDDQGASFTAPRDITASVEALKKEYPWRVVATGPAHGIKTSRGRLIVPLWMSDGSGTEFGAGKLGHRPSVVASIYSTDGGRNWAAGEIVARDGQVVPHKNSTASLVNPSETVAVELADGSILFNLRSESSPHLRVVSRSKDGSAAWSEPRFDEALMDPVCMASIIDAGFGKAIVFANPDNLEHAMTKPTGVNADRKRLSIKLSLDDCSHWAYNRVLEEGPSGYSDLARLPDGRLLCLYECGIVDRMYDDRFLTLGIFDLAWVRDGSRIPQNG